MNVNYLLKITQQVSVQIKRIKCFHCRTIVAGTMKRRKFMVGLENKEQLKRQIGLGQEREEQNIITLSRGKHKKKSKTNQHVLKDQLIDEHIHNF